MFTNRFYLLIFISMSFVLGCGTNVDTDTQTKSKNIIIIGGRGTENGYFISPRTVAYSHLENAVFVVDKSGRIQKFSDSGKFLSVWRVPMNDSLELEKRGYPAGIEISPDNNVYVCDSHQAQVLIYDTAGKMLDKFGMEGTKLGQFGLTGRVVFISSTEYFVSDYKSDSERVTFYESDSPKRIIGSSGRRIGEFARSIGICLDDEEHLYVCDANNHRVQVFDKSGKFLTSFGSEGDKEGELYYPYGIKFDPELKVIIVAEYGNSRLSFFSKTGKFLGHFGGRGILPGQFLGIWDIAIGNKYYYVPDYNNHRLAIIDKNYLRTLIKAEK